MHQINNKNVRGISSFVSSQRRSIESKTNDLCFSAVIGRQYFVDIGQKNDWLKGGEGYDFYSQCIQNNFLRRSLISVFSIIHMNKAIESSSD